MKVLSLFDGMSCGQIALRELGAEVETYYASEIDPHAIRQARARPCRQAMEAEGASSRCPALFAA